MSWQTSLSSLQSFAGSDNITGLSPAFNQTEFNNLSHPTAMEFNPYKVTPELLDHLRKAGVPDPEQHIRNVQQGRYEHETSLYGPKEARGIPLKKKVRVRLPDSRSRKIAPGGEISQSTRKIQGEQDKGKEAEPLNLGKEDIDTLQSFLDALKQNKKTLQGFKEAWKDKEFLEGIENLMKDEKVREYVRSDLKNEGNVKQTILSLENPQVLQDLKEVVNNMQDKEFRGRVLLEAENNVPWEKLSLENGKNITGTELANIRARLQGRQDIINLAKGYNLRTAQFQAARYEIKQSSDQLLAATWQLDSTHVLAYHELNEPVDNVQTQIHLFKVDEGHQTTQLIAKNVNTVDTYGTRVVSDPSKTSCKDQCNKYGCCPGPLGPGYPCADACPTCVSIDPQCSITVCAGCVWACGNPVTCAACFLAFCPIVSFIGCCHFGPGLCCEPNGPNTCNC
jgi:ASC-1-like (ASCH) protein